MSKLILIVEDEIAIRDLLTDIFSDEGYRTIAAGNGKEALHLMKEVYADIIILDLMMPVMNGNEFLSVLEEEKIEIPVIILSATSSKVKNSPLIKAVVSKPFSLDDLVEIVQKLI